jgi:hypothetical protein
VKDPTLFHGPHQAIAEIMLIACRLGHEPEDVSCAPARYTHHVQCRRCLAVAECYPQDAAPGSWYFTYNSMLLGERCGKAPCADK